MSGQPAIKSEAQCGFFKTPTLRNIAKTAPYMHIGVFDNLRDVVAYYVTHDTDPKKGYTDSKKFNDLPSIFHGNVDVTPPVSTPARAAR